MFHIWISNNGGMEDIVSWPRHTCKRYSKSVMKLWTTRKRHLQKVGVGSMHFTTRWSHMLGWEDCLYICSMDYPNQILPWNHNSAIQVSWEVHYDTNTFWKEKMFSWSIKNSEDVGTLTRQGLDRFHIALWGGRKCSFMLSACDIFCIGVLQFRWVNNDLCDEPPMCFGS